jgi:hypothetical protein
MIAGNKIRRALIKLILGTIPQNITGTVVSVDETDHSCVVRPSNGGPDYEGVRLHVSIGNAPAGLIPIPNVNSEVVIAPLYHNSSVYCIVKHGAVKKWRLITVSNGMIDLDENGNIILNANTFGGVPKSGVIATKLNVLETQENDIKTRVSAILAAGVSSPTTPVTNATLAAFFTGFNVTAIVNTTQANFCLLYTSDAADDLRDV